MLRTSKSEGAKRDVLKFRVPGTPGTHANKSPGAPGECHVILMKLKLRNETQMPNLHEKPSTGKLIKLLILLNTTQSHLLSQTSIRDTLSVPWVNPSMCETSWDEERHKTDEPYNEFTTCFHETWIYETWIFSWNSSFVLICCNRIFISDSK